MSIDLEAASKSLSASDPTMANLIATLDPPSFEPRTDYFQSLVRSIVSQQLSVKAARTIFGRFQDELGDINPDSVAALSEDTARSLGLSRQKYSYMQDLADHVTEHNLFEGLEAQDAETTIATLTQVKGIGVWTAEMFMMFTLQRPDIFAADDLGLRRAIEKHYAVAKDSPLDEYRAVAERWQPWRTVASSYLWKSLDNEPK